MSAPEQTTKTAKIGMIGLAVMGENLARNIERNGYSVAVYNRPPGRDGEPDRVTKFMEENAGKQFIGTRTPEEFVKALERPRKVILLVKAGDPVDWTVDQIKPYLEEGDIIIDGGNSYFMDTERREKALKAEGFNFIGSGVSGGEKGALWGPSLMPGGDRQAYEQIRPIWEAIAAKVDDGPCVTYIGPGGAGHFVKMVHNGIEYGDMQLIAEAYDILRRVVGLGASELSDVFAGWNRGPLESFLVEITAQIFAVRDAETGRPLVDLVSDEAGQKGTGKWTAQVALDLAVPVPTIAAAIDARVLSSMKGERVRASGLIEGPRASGRVGGRAEFAAAVHDALYASKVVAYAQGMDEIAAGSDEYDWDIDLGAMARIWRGGCIIRARLLEQIRAAYDGATRRPASLLVTPDFADAVGQAQDAWRRVVTTAVDLGIPTPGFSSALAYYDALRRDRLPAALVQGQRDLFGAHTYKRVDREGTFHTLWSGDRSEQPA
jgi:6-phosphogluconate dehydrogenase